MENLRELAESAAKHEGKTDVHALTDSEVSLLATINDGLLIALLDLFDAADLLASITPCLCEKRGCDCGESCACAPCRTLDALELVEDFYEENRE